MIAQYSRAKKQRNQNPDTQDARFRGNGSGRKKEGIAWKERRYHQTRLAKDDERQDEISGVLILAHDGFEVYIKVAHEVKKLSEQVEHGCMI
jgi:hypothetical protein